jgi:Protein of unknown function (DUF1553)/Protein of unknown function (DUF1549)/Concanavalin A-like lectin/glucanases superfamily/Planctomycete cytochrome C
MRLPLPHTLAALTLAATVTARADTPPPVRFDRDVLPILSENCFQCHGPDEKARKAKLRLDTQAGAKAVLGAGKSAESELVRRIFADADDGRMPPPKSNRTLTAAQKELLRRWIDEGAPWGKHWAYETPRRPALPAVKDRAWPRNAIDFFVLARLEKEGLAPSPEAARETLIRRVTLDLTGLPPTPREVADFLADRSPNAYERVVDRLLASPRYGERMALDWLDAARYADTNGYQNDFARTMWPWRDWVIAAFTRNLPFDRFVVEQLAGDLLPNATPQQKIATGFNRNNRTVTEAGSIDEEWRVENGVDRVETTATVFLGLTLGCARCHDHKYDPLSQREFYQFFAFFNSLNEQGVYTEQRGNVGPQVRVLRPHDEERLRQLDAAIARADEAVRKEEAALAERQRRWEHEQRDQPPPPDAGDWALRLALDGGKSEAVYRGQGQPAWVEGPLGKALRLDGKDHSFFDAGQAVRLERDDRFSYGAWVRPHSGGAILSKMDDAASYRGFDLLVQGGKVEVHLVHAWPENAVKVVTRESLPADAWSHVFVTYDGSGKAAGLRVYLDGRPARLQVERNSLTGTLATEQPFRVGKRSTAFAWNGELADVRVYRRTLTAAEVEAVAAQPLHRILATPAEGWSKAQQDFLARAYRERYATEWRAAKQVAAKRREEKANYEKQIPSVMVMEELPTPRDTFLLKRGRYDQPDRSQKVHPDVPACLPPLPAGAPRNRLGLARWLVDPANPLTARVTVNRLWQRCFGTGLVKTAEDFGIQGEPSSHPELLDWLATEFVRAGWDVKALLRLLVTSATYQQASEETPALLQKDPENRLLARGPRFRLPAELVRDNLLAVSGLLTEKLGGLSVKPYQPAGLWEDLAGGAGEGPYVQDKGSNLYRRSLYIYRKRTVPHPVLATFDAPSREVCQVKRPRTNTPLQALALLNDVTYAEAARCLAQLMLTERGHTAAERLTFAFRRATARAPRADELGVLLRGLERYRQSFRADVKAAEHFIRQGDSPVDGRLDPVELAAYTAVAGVILNLDETITKD